MRSTRTALDRDVGLQARILITLFALGLLYTGFVAVLLLAGAGIVVLSVVVGGIALVQLLLAERLGLKAMRAKVVSSEQAPGLHAIVERLCIQADLPKPRIAISDLPVSNAFAMGRSPKTAVVCVTTEILRALQPRELEAVLAHELGHVKHRDVIVMTLASFFATVAALVTQFGLLFGGGLDDDGDENQPFWLVLLVAFAVYLISHLLILALSRYREFAADREAAVVTGRPSELASALTKLAASAKRAPQQDLRTVEALGAFFIVPPQAKSFIKALVSTHPPVEKRIERLQELEAQLWHRSSHPAASL